METEMQSGIQAFLIDLDGVLYVDRMEPRSFTTQENQRRQRAPLPTPPG